MFIVAGGKRQCPLFYKKGTRPLFCFTFAAATRPIPNP